MREELVKVVYKKSKIEVREKRAKIAACCCKDAEALIAEAQDEMDKEKQIKKRLKTGMSLDLDRKLGKDEQLKLEALQTVKPKGAVRREMKKRASQVWTQDEPDDEGDDEVLASRSKEKLTRVEELPDDNTKAMAGGSETSTPKNNEKYESIKVDSSVKYTRAGEQGKMLPKSTERTLITTDDLEINIVKEGENIEKYELPKVVEEEEKLKSHEYESKIENISWGQIDTEKTIINPNTKKSQNKRSETSNLEMHLKEIIDKGSPKHDEDFDF